MLFIAIDDLNDWIGKLGGHPQTLTPNIDRLADRGVLFANAHCAAPACNPSRAALMTGIAPYRSGVYVNPQPWKPVLKDKVTLPQHFMQHGYRAIGSGKIYHGGYPDPESWHEYWPSQTRNRPGDPTPKVKSVSGLNMAHFDWGPVDVDDSEMGDTQVVDWVIGQLQAKHDKPLFLACGIFRPHLPWYAPRKYFDRFPVDEIQLPEHRDDDLDDIPAAGVKMANPSRDHAAVLKHNQWHAAVQGYLASISYTDGQVGRLLDALDASAYANNTVVVLWTDHGWHLGEKKHWRKFALWEEATRTPLIFVAPRGTPGLPQGTPAGTRIDKPVSLLDIYPTLVDSVRVAQRAMGFRDKASCRCWPTPPPTGSDRRSPRTAGSTTRSAPTAGATFVMPTGRKSCTTTKPTRWNTRTSPAGRSTGRSSRSYPRGCRKRTSPTPQSKKAKKVKESAGW